MFGPTLALTHYFSVCRSRNSPVGHSNFIHGSTQIRHVGVNWFKSRSFYVLNWRVEKFDNWAGPNFPFSPQLVNLGRLDWSYYGIRTPGRLVTDSQGFRWYLGLLYAEVQLADLHSSYRRREHGAAGARTSRRLWGHAPREIFNIAFSKMQFPALLGPELVNRGELLGH